MFYDHTIILVRKQPVSKNITGVDIHLKFRTRATRINNRTVHEGGSAVRTHRCVITLHILPFTGSSARSEAPSLSEELGLGSSPSNSWLISPSSPSLRDEALTVNLWLMMLRRCSVLEFAVDADVSDRPPKEADRQPKPLTNYRCKGR